jgi:hypothetical protein
VFPKVFTSPLEGGAIYWMYQDVKHLITTGRGNLIDGSPALSPWLPALALPWHLPDSSPAPRAQVIAEWQALKAQPGLAGYSAYSKTVQNATTVRLTEEDVDDLVMRRMLENEAVIKHYFSEWDNWCADAQLAGMSTAWAVGAGWPGIFKNCTRSLIAKRFHEVTIRPIGADGKPQPAECDISTTGNAGVVPRNAQNRLCFNNAQIVQDFNLDPDTLYWPNAAPVPGPDIATTTGATLQQEAELALAEWLSGPGAWTGHSDPDA